MRSFGPRHSTIPQTSLSFASGVSVGSEMPDVSPSGVRATAPAPEQIVDYARYIGIDPLRTDLMWIAEQGLTAPLPHGWSVCRLPEDESIDGVSPEVYYYNAETGESIWDHPLDEQFREIAGAFMAVPAADAASVLARHRAHEGLISQVESLGRPRQAVSTQTMMRTADGTTQAAATTSCAETQAHVPRFSMGVDPMPADAVTMTGPQTEPRETMTTPTLRALDAAVGADVVDEPRHRQHASETFTLGSITLRSRRGSQLPSPRGSVRAGMNDTVSETSGRQPTQHVQAAPPPQQNPLSMSTSQCAVPGLAQSQGRAPVDMTTITPAAEALMREMVASFQHQLLEHRREVYDAIAQEYSSTCALRDSLCEPPVQLGRLPAARPLTSDTSPWGAKTWCTCYLVLFAMHMAGCVIVCFALPVVLASDVWDPLIEDPRPVF